MLIRFSDDRLHADISVGSDEIDAATEDKLYQFLKAKGIGYGILTANVTRIIAEKISNKYVRIAEGKPPQSGKDTEFILFFKNEIKAEKPRERENGSVDHRDLGYVIPVKKGGRLIEIIPPSKGVQGIDVFGSIIPVVDGNTFCIAIGENTSLSEDGRYVYAEADGAASFLNQEAKVTTTLLIKSDIDYSVGNIRFPGDITICGSVKDGFTVISEGNILILKDIINATVETKGSIVIKGGINNKTGGHVKAVKDIEVNFIQFGKVHAGEKLIVEKEIMYSNVVAGALLTNDGKDSRILGSNIKCYGKIIAYDLGSRKEASKMVITLSENLELLEAIENIGIKIQANKSELVGIDTEVKYIEQYLAAPNLASDEFHEFEKIYEDFNQKKLEVEKINMHLEEEKNKILNYIKEKGKPMIHVKNSIFPGVTLQFSTRKLDITSEKRRIRIFEENNVINFRPL